MESVSNFINKHRKECGMMLLLILLCIWTILGSRDAGVDALFNSRFLSPMNLTNISRQIGMFGIFSIGVGLVIITSGIDLSVGSLMSLLGVLFFFTLTGRDLGTFMGMGVHMPVMPWAVGLLFIFGLSVFIGLVHGVLVAKYKIQAFIITLCGLLSYRGLARFMADDTSVGYSFTPLDITTLENLCTQKILGHLPMPFVYLILISIVMFIVLHKSVYGRYIFAAGRNELATKYSGINTVFVIGSAYIICTVLTAFSAILFSFYTGSVTPSTHGNFFELYAIAAAVLGGCSLRGGEGSIIGIIIGTSILIVLQNMVNLLGYESSLSDAITGGVIFLGVVADQIGLKGLKGFFAKFKRFKQH